MPRYTEFTQPYFLFRGLLQERLNWYVKPYFAIPLTSMIFALMHVSQGSVQIVSIDLISVFLDSLVFGIIYYQTRNVWVSWLAHFAANLLAYFYIANGLFF
ncbi:MULTISPECIES: CPBP family intramembrane glutamic endopeptidase [Paenibacillus]|uniref:CPBP family intramembrane glutamic endopeptidase n=1 Tax=Paenibacillus TaxID=44249 RepID=UPI000A156B75